MAAYDFPSSPSDGDTVTVSGVTYTYSSSKTRWDGAAASGSSTTAYATIDELPLSGASTGDQAYVSGNNRLYIWNGTGWYNIALINTNPSISGASATYNLAIDGTATTVTITATDPEGIPITYSIASDTSGNVATVAQGTGSNTNVFTITPSTNTANAGTFSLTFRASDGVNIATAVSQFTLVFAFVDSNHTTMLLTSVGANNGVNNSYTDSSASPLTITKNGDTNQVTFSPYRHGGYSTYFDGSGDYLEAAQTTAIGTSDFTFEAWINPTSFGNTKAFFCTLPSGSTSLQINVASAGALEVWYKGANNSDVVTISGVFTLQKWTHIALVGDTTNDTLKVYADGAQIGSTISYAYNYSGTGNYKIGQNRGSATYFEGYLRDLRLVVGSQIYTGSTYDVPTEE